jgi:hypothetical protein
MKYSSGLCILLVLSASFPARAADSEAPAPSTSQSVMQAQYAAREVPRPARPEEAQRIYDSYLRTIGQPTKDSSTDANDTNSTTPH